MPQIKHTFIKISLRNKNRGSEYDYSMIMVIQNMKINILWTFFSEGGLQKIPFYFLGQLLIHCLRLDAVTELNQYTFRAQ